MKKKTVSIICLILALLLVLGSVGTAAFSGIFSVASASSLNTKLDKNKQTQNELKDKLNKTTAEKEEIQKKKRAIDDEISDLASEIDSINKKIAKNNSDIKDKEKEIRNIEKKIDKSDELLRKRLRIMYEKGSATYLEVLFSASSFSDLLVRIDMVKSIYEHDQALIDEMGEAKRQVTAAKQQIEDAKAANVSLKSDLDTQKSAMQAKSNESSALISDLEQTEEELKDEIAAKERENQSILAEIAAARQNAGSNIVNTYTGGTLGWPCVIRGTITSTFGPRTLRGIPNYHTGLDIGVPMGTPVLACEDGVVTGSGWRNAYGYCVTIDHGSITTLYAHNSVLQVRVGQSVKRGQQIALAGSTGNSTGPHIHLGVIKNGQYLDPAPYVGL